MPTGYTANIKKGISFKEFAMQCARAFMVEMRDEPMGVEVSESIPVDNYHLEQLEEALKDLAKLKATKITEANIQAKKAFDSEMVSHNKTMLEKSNLLKKYLEMFKEVVAYEVPSPEHLNFKKFMESQIVDSIGFDCDIDYSLKYQPKLQSGKEWLENAIEMAESEVAYHQKAYNEDVERNAQRNEWVKLLKDSINKID